MTFAIGVWNTPDRERIVEEDLPESEARLDVRKWLRIQARSTLGGDSILVMLRMQQHGFFRARGVTALSLET